jgi:small conductance mechanosensitive channel
MIPRLFVGPVDWQALFTAVSATLLLAVAAAYLVRRVVERLLRGALGAHLAASSPLVRGPLRLIALATFVLATSLLIFPAFELVGLVPRTGVPLRTMTEWAFAHGTKVLLIGLVAYAAVRTVTLLVRRFEHQVSLGTTLDALERAKRARTLGALIEKVSTGLIASIAVLMVLREFGIDITPVLTGAGIAGLAVGFGAQTLVRDIISGFFLILEDQVRVGDVAAINGVGGLVEGINLRTIVLRDEEGAVHVFPNGAITTLSNRSKDYSFYVITLAVPYSEDVDAIVEMLKQVGSELQADPRYGPFILEPIEILGVDAYGDWSMQLKLRIKTVPLKQWEVGRQLRRRIRIALNRAGIPVPFPALAATSQVVKPPTQPTDAGV